MVGASLGALAIWFFDASRATSQESTATPSVGTATAQIHITATAIAHENPDIWLRFQDDRGLLGRAEVRIDASLRIPMRGELEIVIFDDDSDKKKTYIAKFTDSENEYTSLRWKYRISRDAIGHQREIDRMTVQFIPEDGNRINLICRQHSSSDSEFGVHSCVAESGSIIVAIVQATATAEIRTAVARQTRTAHANHTATAYAPTAAAQTHTAVARQTATAAAYGTATTRVHRTATAHASTATAETQTAVARQTSAALTAAVHRVTARAQQTATAAARTTIVAARNQTATSSVSTARAQQTATASARPTNTPRPTIYYVHHTSSVNVRSCASTTCARVGTIPPGQAIAVLREEAGDPVNGDTRWLAFTFDGQTRYLHASLATMTQPTSTPRPTNTPLPTRTPRPSATTPIRWQAAETYYVISTAANARPCPTLTESCASVRRFNYRDAITVIGEAVGDSYQGSTNWKVIEVGNQRLYIHATLLSRSRPAAVVNPTAPRTGGGSAGGGASGIGRSSEYVPGSCAEVRRVTGSCNFPPGDPNYSRRRDRDNDNLACEC